MLPLRENIIFLLIVVLYYFLVKDMIEKSKRNRK